MSSVITEITGKPKESIHHLFNNNKIHKEKIWKTTEILQIKISYAYQAW